VLSEWTVAGWKLLEHKEMDFEQAVEMEGVEDWKDVGKVVLRG